MKLISGIVMDSNKGTARIIKSKLKVFLGLVTETNKDNARIGNGYK